MGGGGGGGGAFLGINQFRRVGLRFVCWFYDGNTQRLTVNGLMEKLGIEPTTPGLQEYVYPLYHGVYKVSSSTVQTLMVKRISIVSIETINLFW